uniref:Uncharacterized protein n=1 Tax=Arundo donax TaxID=35708 RepID=A0A0A9HJA9_ARUDO
MRQELLFASSRGPRPLSLPLLPSINPPFESPMLLPSSWTPVRAPPTPILAIGEYFTEPVHP